MSSTYYFERENLKPLLTSYINSNFDFEAVPLQLRKSMRLCLWENIPYVWLSDGYHFIEGLFTKEAVNEFRKNYPHIKFSALRDKMILASKWSLRVRQTDSRKDYTSY